MRMIKSLVSLAFLAALPLMAQEGLSYENPQNGTFRFVQNQELSTPKRIVLDLMGVEAPEGNGMAFILDGHVATQWAPVKDSTFLSNGTVLDIGTAPSGLQVRVAGHTFQGLVSQKTILSPVSLNGKLATLALELKEGATLTTENLSPKCVKARVTLKDGSLQDVELVFGKVGIK